MNINNLNLKPDFGLLPYQAAFAANPSRFKIGLWARQTGKDHTATFEAVVDSIRNPGTDWVIVAAGERQAIESLNKAKQWAEILQLRIADYSEEKNSPAARLKSAEITWANGSRLLALPANPPTIRGYCGNLILTEFAFHEDADAVWKAIFPSVTNPLGGVKKIRIISTPNGLNNRFAKMWLDTPGSAVVPTAGRAAVPAASFPLRVPAFAGSSAAQRADQDLPFRMMLDPQSPHPTREITAPAAVNLSLYHKSKITIYDAIKNGLPLNADELRAGLNDEEAWSQEYLCEFMDTSTVLFPYDLIAPCESEQATETGLPLTNNPSPSLFAGLDFGRKHHLTVCWILERLPALGLPALAGSSMTNEKCSLLNAQWIFITREVLCLKNTSTPEQLEILRPRLKRCRKICLDYTGAGVGLGDYIAREFGCRTGASTGLASVASAANTGKVELCQFTSALKAELFPRLRAAFENRILRIPISREIREDLHAIQRTVSHSGQITYRAPHTPDGHSDRTTALALALRAAHSAPASAIPTIVHGPRPRSGPLGCSIRMPRNPRRRIWL